MRLRINDRRTIDKKRKALLDFARSYLSEAFPNPDREGCPPDVVLRSLASNPIEGQPAVTEHLAACSPCFTRYSELLAELNCERELQKGFLWGNLATWIKTRPALVGTAAVGLLIVAIGVGLLLRGTKGPLKETNQKPNPTEPRNPTVAYLPFSLDLSTRSPARGSKRPIGTEQTVPVPNSTLDLTVILPLGSPEGSYDLRLTAESKTLWSKSVEAQLHKGKTVVQVEVDFRQIPPGNYNLQVEYSTSVRLIQPVSIQAVSPPGREQKP